MVKQEKSVHKNKMGRPPGRLYRETIPVRLTEEAVAAIDAWCDRQSETVSRSEAIRRLIEQGLAAEPKRGKR
jgi:metal-responsive CopG/Arc/MetJ family transcriptional regulator